MVHRRSCDWLRRSRRASPPASWCCSPSAPPRRRRRPALNRQPGFRHYYRCVGRIATSPPTCADHVQQVASLTLTQNGAPERHRRERHPTTAHPDQHRQRQRPFKPDYRPLRRVHHEHGADLRRNGSGQPTGFAIHLDRTLNSGAAFRFIVAATLPLARPTAGQTKPSRRRAHSVFGRHQDRQQHRHHHRSPTTPWFR